MQQPQQLMTPSFPPTNIIITEKIQRAALQKNLMYLAAITDTTTAPAIPPYMSPNPLVQQGAYLMQHPRAAVMAQQAGIFPPEMQLQSGTLHSMIYPQQLQQQAMQGQMGTRPVAANNNMHPMHANTTLGSSGQSQSPTAGGNVVRSGNKQDANEAGATGIDG